MLALLHRSAKSLGMEYTLPRDVHSYFIIAGGPAHVLLASKSSQFMKLVLKKQGLPKPTQCLLEGFNTYTQACHLGSCVHLSPWLYCL